MSAVKVALSVLGLMLAILAWEEIHPIVGILVGFLFVGGIGWMLLGAAIVAPFTASHREFHRAWENSVGPLGDNRRGLDWHYARLGYRAWKRTENASAADFVSRFVLFERPPFPGTAMRLRGTDDVEWAAPGVVLAATLISPELCGSWWLPHPESPLPADVRLTTTGLEFETLLVHQAHGGVEWERVRSCAHRLEEGSFVWLAIGIAGSEGEVLIGLHRDQAESFLFEFGRLHENSR